MPPPAVRLFDVHKTLGDKPVLRGVNLEVARGETLCILGRSGSGKSVLLRHLVGLMSPDAGTVEVCGSPLTGGGREALDRVRARIGYLFQGAALLHSLTVFENVALPLRERGKGMDEAELRRQVEDRLGRVGLRDAAEKFPAELSGGMRKRVGLARAIVGRPELLLYDEPTAGLDPPGAAGIGRLIRELQRSLGVTSLIVSHDLELVRQVADRVAFLDEGRLDRVSDPRSFAASEDPVVREFLSPAEGRRGPEPRRRGAATPAPR